MPAAMRVLFVSNFYPPRTNGGYEQWCQEVAVSLAARGHQLCVLTSTGGTGTLGTADDADDAVEVHRSLHLEVEGGVLGTALRIVGSRPRLERANIASIRQLLNEYQPDAALIWGMWNVPRSVPAVLEERLGSRAAYYFCDYWPTLPTAYLQQMQEPARRPVTQFPKQLLSRPLVNFLASETLTDLRFEHPICVSQAVRRGLVEAGIPVSHAEIVYGGTRVNDLPPISQLGREGELRLLYAGRLTPAKGVHTAIEALNVLAQGDARVSLDIVGRGDPDYEQYLRTLTRQRGLDNRVIFRGGVSHADMPRVLREHDALLLLSEWEEPFARVVLEAMAAGLVVVGTLTGGTAEILVEGETGLAFQPGDWLRLALQIRRLLDEPALRARLSDAGRQRVEDRFTLERMVDQLEHSLVEISSIAQLAR